MQPVAFLFDYASPYAYLANALLESELEGLGSRALAISYQPVYLRGFDTFSTAVPFSQAKLIYMAHDLERCAEHHGIALTHPNVFPINGLYALRIALAARDMGRFDSCHEALFHATWRDQRNISQLEEALAVAAEAGLDAHELSERIAQPALKQRLKDDTAAAAARGVFGVPAFFVGDELFWGHDRLAYVLRAAARSEALATRD